MRHVVTCDCRHLAADCLLLRLVHAVGSVLQNNEVVLKVTEEVRGYITGRFALNDEVKGINYFWKYSNMIASRVAFDRRR